MGAVGQRSRTASKTSSPPPVNEAWPPRLTEAMKARLSGMMGGLNLPGLMPDLQLVTAHVSPSPWRGSSTSCASCRHRHQVRPAPRLPRPPLPRRRRRAPRRRHPRNQKASPPLLGLQQHHRHRSMQLLHKPYAQPAPGLRSRRAHQHRRDREDPQLQRRLSRPSRNPLAHRRRRPGAAPHPATSSPALEDVDEVILATSPTIEGEATAGYHQPAELRRVKSPPSESHPHSHRRASRKRHRVRRRSHHEPLPRRPPRLLGRTLKIMLIGANVRPPEKYVPGAS